MICSVFSALMIQSMTCDFDDQFVASKRLKIHHACSL